MAAWALGGGETTLALRPAWPLGRREDGSKSVRGALCSEFENIIRVDRPMGEVFAFLSDFANIPKWNYFVLEVRRLSESPIGIGTSYHQVKTSEQDFRIIEF